MDIRKLIRYDAFLFKPINEKTLLMIRPMILFTLILVLILGRTLAPYVITHEVYPWWLYIPLYSVLGISIWLLSEHISSQPTTLNSPSWMRLNLNNERQISRICFIVFLLLFSYELIRTAWITDDAAITLRTVLNFTHGYGLTFNIDERVQAFTHPLWLFLISGLTIPLNNVFAATFLLSISLSIFTLWLFFTKVPTYRSSGILSVIVLLLSKAYIDFSTSGLENPLSHLLLLISFLLALKAIEKNSFKILYGFFTTCSLMYLTRPDLLVLLFPIALFVVIKNLHQPKELLKAFALGAIPALVWTLFSLYYYGFPFPNTAYAKLGTGIPFHERFLQGLLYISHNLNTDPITLVFIFTGIVFGVLSSGLEFALSLGIIFYLFYILSIGGDFMEGRFFTVPLLAAAIIVSRFKLEKNQLIPLGAFLCSLGIFTLHSTLFSGPHYTDRPIDYYDGIADFRGVYNQSFGLLRAPKGTFSTPDWSEGKNTEGVMCGHLGYASIFGGPNLHLVDICALADPLLARLPAKYDPSWKIGHFVRQLPAGYLDSLKLNKNVVKDPKTKAYYDTIRTITRGNLNSEERFRDIFHMNLGEEEQPNWSLYRYESIPQDFKIYDMDIFEFINQKNAGLKTS